jgi:hypothetical protein
MKIDRIMWGLVLLFIGGVLLLENFNIIDFHWGRIWKFWPIFLIIGGVNILFSKNKSQIGGILSLAILVVTLGILFYKGQQPKEERIWVRGSEERTMDGGEEGITDATYFYNYADSSIIKSVLNITGGGTSFELNGATDSLFVADVHRKQGAFSLETNEADSITTVNFNMKGKSDWNIGEGRNEVDIKMNTHPVWEVSMKLGAGKIDFDLSAYKIRKFNFDGGAAALEIRFGQLLPITDVNIKTGVADVKIEVPSGSGCRIKTKTGLSSRDFPGFTKIEEGLYESPNYKTSAKKIFVNLDGGLSNFEVKRY